MSTKRSGFTTGSGCYTCISCKRKTRDDGNGDSVNCRLCTECFELSGIKNSIADGDTDYDAAQPMIEDLKKRIRAKGGTI